MNSNEWITDRRPTDDDAYYVTPTEGIVFITNGHDVEVALYHEVDIGTPWMSIPAPEPYVKPKRYGVRYSEDLRCWSITITDGNTHIGLNSRLFEPLSCLNDKNSDKHREAAERIAAIYEEMMP